MSAAVFVPMTGPLIFTSATFCPPRYTPSVRPSAGTPPTQKAITMKRAPRFTDATFPERTLMGVAVGTAGCAPGLGLAAAGCAGRWVEEQPHATSATARASKRIFIGAI